MILASQSTSRKKILTDLGYYFRVEISDTEEYFDTTLSAEENSMNLALQKAKAVAQRFPNELVIGCDTIQIDPNGKLLEKPKDRNDAWNMMKNRSGKSEILISGIAFVSPKGIETSFETSILHWKEMRDEEIEMLINTNEWKGKCGGIAIEGISGLFCTKLEGSIANVMGFPLQPFWEYIKRNLS